VVNCTLHANPYKSHIIEKRIKLNAKDNIAHLGREVRRKDPLREDVGDEAGLFKEFLDMAEARPDSLKSSHSVLVCIFSRPDNWTRALPKEMTRLTSPFLEHTFTSIL